MDFGKEFDIVLNPDRVGIGERTMNENPYGFDMNKLLLGLIKLMKDKGLLEEGVLLDLLWEAKDPYYPWDKADIKELLKL